MSPVWQIFGILAFVLQILFVGSMQHKGLFRRYPFLFLYSLVLLLAGVIEWATLKQEGFANYYWSNEIILQILLLFAMLHFIYVALATDPSRMRKVVLIGGAIIIVSFAVATLKQTPPPSVPIERHSAYFMTMLSRNLSFCSALLNVILWNSLLHYRRRDSQMLMLAAGVGIFTTGKAIGHSMRMIDRSLATAGNGVVVVSALLALALWVWTCWALRPSPISPRRLDGPAGEPAPTATHGT
ncbi:MAG: hypothetical protein ABI972_23335 [Acidobacteriota bacterium]